MISNQVLFKSKKEILTSLSESDFSKKSFKHKVSCLYHGVPLVFYTNSYSFYNELLSYLPTSWKLEDTNQLHDLDVMSIYIKDYKDYGYDFNTWSDELSQDCIIQKSFIYQRDFAARILTPKKITLITEPKVCDGFYNFLRWYLPLELIKVNKLILHSSCILDKNSSNAHFFLGHSGAGKTTITELSSPRKILGDDMNLLSLDKTGLRAQAGAIGGYFKPQVNYSDSFPIKSFNWIIQSQENKRVKLSTAQARTKLMASVSNIFWESLDREQTDFIFETVMKAVSEVPVYELHFKKDSSFWNTIE